VVRLEAGMTTAGWSGLVQVERVSHDGTFTTSAGLVVAEGVVIDAAPILSSAVGERIEVAAARLRARGFTVSAVPAPTSNST
jgi:hypothetical protein